jgi:hypothetical protein
MPVIINLSTNFAFNVQGSGDFSLPSEVKTITDLLRHISKEIEFDLIDPDTGELDIDLEITINGKDLWFFPTGLKTPLNHGDSVLVSLIPLGGGSAKRGALRGWRSATLEERP